MPKDFDVARPSAALDYDNDGVTIPDYLEKHYWWAYVRPWAVWTFEREWLVNLILWGWYKPLRNAALETFGNKVSGKTLQISCCYGTFTPQLAERVTAGGGHLDVLDVSPAQLRNLRRKLPTDAPVDIYHQDSTALGFPDARFDRATLFFLPHEQPRAIRERSFAEAVRVLKPGGTLLVVEFDKPKWWHPLKYLWLPFLGILEPFAPDLWKHETAEWLPPSVAGMKVEKKNFFGNFYQRLLITKPQA
ncbi:MAG: methyltransferase domain-containing protein [Alphaproteobacteria bacterium]|nr:methyltransferase domain-containing protein [Alphaproteobacteria bacterium]